MLNDLISRQAAIDAVLGVAPYDEYWKEQIEKAVNALQSAQPEIIRCKDCKYAKWDDERGDYICNGRAVWENHYCGYAKKKGEEHD